jgi:hypothetical protein
MLVARMLFTSCLDPLSPSTVHSPLVMCGTSRKLQCTSQKLLSSGRKCAALTARQSCGRREVGVRVAGVPSAATLGTFSAHVVAVGLHGVPRPRPPAHG